MNFLTLYAIVLAVGFVVGIFLAVRKEIKLRKELKEAAEKKEVVYEADFEEKEGNS